MVHGLEPQIKEGTFPVTERSRLASLLFHVIVSISKTWLELHLEPHTGKSRHVSCHPIRPGCGQSGVLGRTGFCKLVYATGWMGQTETMVAATRAVQPFASCSMTRDMLESYLEHQQISEYLCRRVYSFLNDLCQSSINATSKRMTSRLSNLNRNSVNSVVEPNRWWRSFNLYSGLED